MVMTLRRTFPVQSAPSALFNLASLPLLAPKYLNFLARIALSGAEPRQAGWTCYDVVVTYRLWMTFCGVVHHHVDGDNQTVRVHHNGNVAAFDAVFQMHDGLVQLECVYRAKIPLVTSLVAVYLDRVLSQIALAMDRYAASVTPSLAPPLTPNK